MATLSRPRSLSLQVQSDNGQERSAQEKLNAKSVHLTTISECEDEKFRCTPLGSAQSTNLINPPCSTTSQTAVRHRPGSQGGSSSANLLKSVPPEACAQEKSCKTAIVSASSPRLYDNAQNPFGADLVRYVDYRSSSSTPSVVVDLSSSPAATTCDSKPEKMVQSKGRHLNLNNTTAGNGNFRAGRKAKEQLATGQNPAMAGAKQGNLGQSEKIENAKNSFDSAQDLKPMENNGATGFLRNRFSTRRIRNRLMQKDGECNISLHNVPKQKTKYFADIFTTLVEVKWRWCLLIFALGFLLSWLLFAVVYYLIMLSHGDFDHLDDKTWHFCVNNIKNFVSIFMFSLESQHTIGYGSRYPSEECPVTVAVVCLQSMVGVMIQTLMAGIVFAKLARAKKRAQTLIFSKNAVVCMRDGKLCILFRVGDMRKSQLAEAHIRVQMISKRITNEGELLPFHQFDMSVGYDAGLDRVFVVWPITICHVIDEDSPLYDYSADDLASARFEIIAILEGVVPSTGTTMQARTSYLPSEILWGHRFEKLVTYQRENGEYRIDFSKFHNTYPQETPTCSGRDLDLLKENGLNLEEVYQIETEEQAENQGLTPYSTISACAPELRPSILPILSPVSNAGESSGEKSQEACEDNDLEDDEHQHLLASSLTSPALLISMTPAERKASIVAVAAAFRKQKTVPETGRKTSLGARMRKVSNLGKPTTSSFATATQRIPLNLGGGITTLRHAVSVGSVPASAAASPPGPGAARERPNSILREHDIM